MSIFKCKMCGGTLEFNPGDTVAVCDSCGTRQTLPRLEDDRRANLYDRANHFRRSNEFDKAMGIYEQILAEDSSDAEAYWSLVLCRYGIEYVEDPVTHKRVPTVNRAQYTSIFDDDNYKSALRCADAAQRGIYEAEAHAINEIQKGILAISQQEEPFDVFICYKETDNSGRRTPDSVLANDLYHQLTQEGFKVFFSRITLEDKLGSAYEPYIFAALNSAKVMVALGTRPEYFKAVWVKNEWSRYLALIRQGQKKMLIPAYKDMDPYDLPEEFSHLQAQDMAKLGFMQDLIRGIRKILQADAPRPVVKETTVVAGGGNAAPLLDRGTMALEDGEWEKADGFFEDVLNQDSKNARAYLGKALAQEQCATLEALIDRHSTAANIPADDGTGVKVISLIRDEAHIAEIVDQYSIPGYLSKTEINQQYQYELPSYTSIVALRQQQRKGQEAWWTGHKLLTRAEKFAEGDLARELQAAKHRLLDTLDQRIQQAKDDEAAHRQQALETRAQQLKKADQAVLALYKSGLKRREENYRALVEQMEKAHSSSDFFEAAIGFEKLGDYQDSPSLVQQCRRRAEEQKRTETKKTRKVVLIVGCAVAATIALVVLLTQVILPYVKYSNAVALMDAGQYDEAIAAFEAMDGYKDSAEQIESCLEMLRSLVPGRTLSAGRDLTLGLCSDGTVVAVGINDYGQRVVSGWEYIVAISAGGNHTVGLKSDGTVVAKGLNDGGQCNVAGWRTLVAISAGINHTVGLKSDGTVVAAGSNAYGQCDVRGWTNIVAISAGGNHAVALKADGTVVAAGSNAYGQCDVRGWTNIVAIAAGGNHTVALKSDGTVVATGFNNFGQCVVSDWTDIVAISAGINHTVGLKSDGTVVATGYNNDGQCDVSDWTDIVAISAGNYHTVGLKSDGTVVAVGSNTYGQCDVSSWTNIALPK